MNPSIEGNRVSNVLAAPGSRNEMNAGASEIWIPRAASVDLRFAQKVSPLSSPLKEETNTLPFHLKVLGLTACAEMRAAIGAMSQLKAKSKEKKRRKPLDSATE